MPAAIQSVDIRKSFGDRNRGAAAWEPARISVARGVGSFAEFWPRSDHRGAARCYAFQCADVLALQLDTVVAARGAEPLFVAVFGRSGEPIALLPLSIEHDPNYTRLCKDARILRFIDGGLADYNAPVLFPPVAQWNGSTVRAIWRALRRLLPPFDIAVLDKMPGQVGDFPNPLTSLGAEQGVSGHAGSLGGTWESVKARLPRRNVWKTRRFRELGEITLELATTPAQYDLVLETLIEQKRRRNREAGNPDLFRKPGYLKYLQSAKSLLYPAGPVCLFSLRIKDAIVATSFGLATGQRFTGQLTGFAGEEWRAYSLGHLLHNKIFEWCFNERFEFYDFGVGDEAYKTPYCDTDIPLYRAEIPVSPQGRIAVYSRSLKTRLRGLGSRFTRKYTDRL